MPVPEHTQHKTEIFLTALEAAARLGVNERTVRRAIARGELRSEKVAGSFHIALADLEHFRMARARPQGVRPGPEAEPTQPSDAAQFASGPRSLPSPLTSLIGRDGEIAEFVTTLRGPERLLTLTGPGGVGKTRLALGVAAALGGDFASVCYVSLAAVASPDRVAAEIADALGVQQIGEGSHAERLVASLRERQLLLVLDNFEPVIESAPLVATLLAACPSLKVLATSRIRLRVSGECERPVQPLPVSFRSEGRLTRANAHGAISVSDPDHLSPAVQLFIERAHAVRSGLVASAEDEAKAVAICQRLDGLPLAIELAAARVNVLPLPDLLARLERRLPVLTGGPRDAPARLRTMRDAIAWSYDLLDDDERRLFRSLAIFAGGFTLAAAEGISTPDLPVFDLLASLVDKSLIGVQGTPGGETRYSLLETIREFGLEQLAESGEQERVAQRHATWCLAFAVDAGPRVKQADAATWLPRLRAEHPNLLVALRWFERQRDGTNLVRMAAALWPFWQEQNAFAEGLRWLEPALALGQDAPAPDRLRALAGAGTLAWYLTQVERALAWHEQALALARAEGDRIAEARALCDRSWLLAERGDLDDAIASCEASLALARSVGAADPTALALHNLACLSRMAGDLHRANACAGEALALARSEGWEWLVTMILVGFGYTTLELGEVERAASLLQEALERGSRRGDLVDVNTALEGLATVEAASGRSELAVRLFAAASALRDEIVMPMAPTERAYFVPILDHLRAKLGDARYAAAWTAGRSSPRDVVITEALAMQATRATPAPRQPQLSRRERDVLRELIAGKSNREISETLFVSPTTVASHIASLYRKIGVDSRAEAVAWAHRHEFA
jgi:non-specific serine/threonine protein kinase